MTTRMNATSSMLDSLVKAALLTLVVGCGSNQVSIGEQNVDAAAGGATAASSSSMPVGGASLNSSSMPVGGASLNSSSVPEGGASKVGGSSAVGGHSGAAGDSKAGGASALAGTTSAAGGASLLGGSTSPGGSKAGGNSGTSTTGGSTARCGGIVGSKCPSGSYCDYGSCLAIVEDAIGTCVVRPDACTQNDDPVCGCDGKTYSNDCLRMIAGVGKSSDGACKGTGGNGGTGGATAAGGAGGAASGGTTGTSSSSGQMCGGFAGKGCGTNEFCEYTAGTCGDSDASGTCVGGVGTIGCPTVWQPVCGCDGKTYGSDCDRRSRGVSKKADGECAKSDGGVSDAASDAAALCTATGGQVKAQSCCSGVGDFPNSCLTGACGCAPEHSHDITVCICPKGCFVPGVGCFSCTPGADQTCNNDPTISALHGTCAANGRCDCHEGYAGLDNGKCK